MSAPAAGWYPDPRGAASTYRWWDGTGWSHELSSDPQAPAPTEESHPATGDPDPVSPPPGVRYEHALDPAYQRSPRTEGFRPSVPVIVGIAVLVLLVATTAVVFGVRGRAVSAAPPLLPPAPVTKAAAPVSLDRSSRQAQVADVVATLPGEPWAVSASDAPGTLAGMFTGYVVAQTTVHAKYDGANDWTAAIFLGALDPTLVAEGDQEATAAALEQELRTRFYGDVTVTPGKAESSLSSVSDRPVGTRQLSFRLEATGLPSAYDRVSILVVGPASGMPSGPTIAFVSMRPDDLSKTSLSQLDATLDSLDLA